MKATLFLRIAAVLTCLEAILHTIGGVFGKPTPGAAMIAVTAMQANRFPVPGAVRSYWDFYFGFGIAITIFLLMEALLFWVLGSIAKTNPRVIRPILIIFFIGYLALAINGWLYIFFGPVLNDILVALCLGFALRTLPPATIPPVGLPSRS
jgi:hypothetical protein